MKKCSLILLLIPSLFLLVSCGAKSPNIDAISEDEAIKYIDENYKLESAVKPSASSKATWQISKENEGKAKKEIVGFIGQEVDTSATTEANITEERCLNYQKELSDATLGGNGIVYITMNPTFHGYLVKSSQNSKVSPERSLVYKYARPGLTITSKLMKSTATDNYIHTYDIEGKEIKFERIYQDDNLDFTLTIDFVY